MGISMAVVMVGFGAGCGSDTARPDHTPTCRVDSCGNESFRRAVPTRADVLIRFPATAGAKVSTLDAVAGTYLWTGDLVGQLNDEVDDVFLTLEDAVSGAPEIADGDVHQWRVPQGSRDAVLRLDRTGDDQFLLTYDVVPTGEQPSPDAILAGEVAADAFETTIDLDALTDVEPGASASGQIVLRTQPFANGLAEHWYDFHQVSLDGEPAEDSRLTYWEFTADSAALELVGDFGDRNGAVYVRWDDSGGRYDHHLDVIDGTEELLTNCWVGGGAEVFLGAAWTDELGDWTAELDGSEDDCVFGPVADLPVDADEFDDLPAPGEWSQL